MEKITIFLAAFIILFLIYSYIKFKRTLSVKEKKSEKKENYENYEKKENYEKHIITAIIATVMGDKKYKIRNIFLEKEEKNKKSAWKTAGRNYNMQRRDRI